jgi:hypothetical protein
MRIRGSLMAAASLLLISCGSEPKPAAVPQPVRQAEVSKPPDESRRFPQPDLVETKVVNDHLLGKAFMPGGTLAHYKKGKLDYEMFLAKLATPTDAAILLPDWRKALADVKPVPSFGGLFGSDGGRPVFVFTKGAWMLGIAGLNEQDADQQGRVLAGRVN